MLLLTIPNAADWSDGSVSHMITIAMDLLDLERHDLHSMQTIYSKLYTQEATVIQVFFSFSTLTTPRQSPMRCLNLQICEDRAFPDLLQIQGTDL